MSASGGSSGSKSRKKRSKAVRSERAPNSETIAPPPLDPNDVYESDAPVPSDDEGPDDPTPVALPSNMEGAPDAQGDAADENVEANGLEAAEMAGDAEEPAHDTTAPGGGDGKDTIEEARDLTQEHLRGLLEALIYAADKPMSTGELAKMASAPLKQVRPLLGGLREHYARRGIVLDEVAGGWLFRTNVQFAPFVRELTSDRPVKLTRAQVETLAITAYRQPITRPEIDEIRGVDSGATLKLLLERDLVRILGKKDEPGRPLLYGTTTHFLEFFGLKSLKDLPTLREFTELSDESRMVAAAELGDVLGETPMAPRVGHDVAGASPSAPAVEPLPPGETPGFSTAIDVEADRKDGQEAEGRVPDGFDDDGVAHDTVIPSAPPTGEVDDPDGPPIDEP